MICLSLLEGEAPGVAFASWLQALLCLRPREPPGTSSLILCSSNSFQKVN